MTDIISLYTGVDNYLWGDMSHVKTNFAKKLEDLYLHVLEFLIKAACYFELSTTKRLVRNIPKLDDWDSQLRRIRAIDEGCQRLAATCAFEDHRQGLSNLADILEQQRTYIQELAQSLKNQFNDNLAVTKWVSDIDVEGDHSLVRQKLGSQYADSGQWLQPRYQRWMELAEKPTFWLCGSGEYQLNYQMSQTLITFYSWNGQE